MTQDSTSAVTQELRERLKLKYVSYCECGSCHCVPYDLIGTAASTIEALSSNLDEAASVNDYNFRQLQHVFDWMLQRGLVVEDDMSSDTEDPLGGSKNIIAALERLVAERDDLTQRITDACTWRDKKIADLNAERHDLIEDRNMLAAEVERQREALRPFAAIAEGYCDEEDDEFQVWQDFDILGARLPLRIFRRARTALEGATHG